MTTWTGAACAPLLRAQRGQVTPVELWDVTRGRKAVPPQSLLEKGKGKGKKLGGGGGASQPTTYRDVHATLEQALPGMRQHAEDTTAIMLSTPGHSHAAHVRIPGGPMLRRKQRTFIETIVDAARERNRLHSVGAVRWQ